MNKLTPQKIKELLEIAETLPDLEWRYFREGSYGAVEMIGLDDTVCVTTSPDFDVESPDENGLYITAFGPPTAKQLCTLAMAALEMAEALESIAAEKCSPSFDERLQQLERGALISIIDTDTAIARETLANFYKVLGE